MGFLDKLKIYFSEIKGDRHFKLTLVSIVVAFLLIYFLAIFVLDIRVSSFGISGRAIIGDYGIIRVGVLGLNKDVMIYSPDNITYNFDKGDLYIIELNVSAIDFVADSWEYSLYDNTHGAFVYQNVSFSPNSSVTAVRWSNTLIVRAHETDGDWYSSNVTFFVEVPNSAPLLGAISDDIFVCEGENLYYSYNATDIDEEILSTDIDPTDIFFARVDSYDGLQNTFFRIISLALDKSDVGGVGGVSKSYSRTISVFDSDNLVDSKDVNITVIEVNNAPVINNNLGAQTVWIEGDDSLFYHKYDVTDVEDGNSNSGNLSFSIDFGGISDIFSINDKGVMSFSPDESEVGNVYSVEVCVEDNPLPNSDVNFGECFDSGKSNDSYVVCDDFTLTVTDENRAPLIVYYSPENSTIEKDGSVTTSFYLEAYDADGTIPDIDWYIDSELEKHTENVTNDTVSVAFSCGVGGTHYVDAVVSDGLLNDSFTWDVDVNYVACPTPSSSGRSGGGGGGSIDPNFCKEDWECSDFDVCQNAKRSFDSGILSSEDYIYISEVCAQNGFDDERFCGFQVRSCVDLNSCSNEVRLIEPPEDSRICYFTENPSCFDGITNCHDGACESLVDCGGPCGKCPTCSDGIQNQGEEDTDCGGPCPFLCEVEVPIRNGVVVLLILSSILLLGIIGFFGYKLFLILRKRYYS